MNNKTVSGASEMHVNVISIWY